MPTYEYECDGCQKTFDQFQSITAKPIERCPSCGGHVHRLIGKGAGIIFRGSGFYQTDYRSSSYQKAADAEKRKTSGKSSGPCAEGACGTKACPAAQT